uniref:hypothetical protein n=1 Tax=Paraprevotella clara TaxID=454154 RepID=UPI00307BF9EB
LRAVPYDRYNGTIGAIFSNKEQWIELLSNREAIKHEVHNALEYQKQICIKSIKEFYQQA